MKRRYVFIDGGCWVNPKAHREIIRELNKLELDQLPTEIGLGSYFGEEPIYYDIRSAGQSNYFVIFLTNQKKGAKKS